KDIQARTCQLAGVERVSQRRLVDQLPSAGVEQQGARFHPGQALGIDERPGLRVQRAVKAHNVALAEERFYIDKSDERCGRLDGSSVGQKAHAKGAPQSSNGLTNPAISHD